MWENEPTPAAEELLRATPCQAALCPLQAVLRSTCPLLCMMSCSALTICEVVLHWCLPCSRTKTSCKLRVAPCLTETSLSALLGCATNHLGDVSHHAHLQQPRRNRRKPGNCRGIAFVTALAKLYATILNQPHGCPLSPTLLGIFTG